MKKNERFVITINRELGSGGRTVGRVLAEKLGVPYYDKMLSKALTVAGGKRLSVCWFWEKEQPILLSITTRIITGM